MATTTIQLRVGQRWWLRAYLACVLAISRVTGMEPDMAKVRRWIERGIYVRVVR